MKTKGKIQLTDIEKKYLISLSRSQVIESRYVVRAKIILLTEQDLKIEEIMQLTNSSRCTVNKWRNRFLEFRIEGLNDKPRPGRVPIYSAEEKANVIKVACSKPEDGYTTWSQDRIAKETGISKSHVNRILKESSIKPHKTKYWCGRSEDPEFQEKMVNIIGLYMDPPENALVICVDEKTQIQALDRTQPELPMKSGEPKRLTATYKRNGTVSLIAALSVHHGEITAKTIDKNNSDNFLLFLKKLDRQYRKVHLHIIADNLSVHKDKKIKEWLSHKKRKITMHFTPTYSSWLNMIEIWFGIITKDVLKNGVWKSKKQLVDQMMAYIKTYNETRAKPFNWTYTGKPLKI
jgi:transposase